jgi:hypothetical protein
MPYTPKDRQEAVRLAVAAVQDPGDLTFLISVALLKTYIDRPKFDTIHALKKDFVVDPKHNSFLQKLRTRFAYLFTTADVYSCAALAFDEFSRRVVAAHEDKKMVLNGDVAEFKEALALIEAMKAPVVEEVTK